MPWHIGGVRDMLWIQKGGADDALAGAEDKSAAETSGTERAGGKRK